jgi:signal recognition particle GTPase
VAFFLTPSDLQSPIRGLNFDSVKWRVTEQSRPELIKDMGIFKNIFSKEKKEHLDKGLAVSKQTFFDKLSKAVVGKSKVDDAVLDDLEQVLISSDVGVVISI